MKTLAIAAVSLFLFSCSGYDQKHICTCDELKDVRGFVERSIEPSNNLSDEEMEDVINQLYIVGVKTTCGTRMMPVNSQGWVDYENAQLDSCETVVEKLW